MSLDHKYQSLAGPILVIGASGFVGANLLRRCLATRSDVVGTVFSGDCWRLRDVRATNLAYLNIRDPVSILSVVHRVQPKTIFDCSSFGAYFFEQDFERIHATNYLSLIRILEQVAPLGLAAYVHAGSSSEYGLNAAAPRESDRLIPNSHYAVSKAAAAQAITYYGKVRGVPVVNLRIYSVYGPYEDSSRLIPSVCEASLRGSLPVFGRADVSRDFVHVDDVAAAFADAALHMSPAISGESFNVGTGVKTSLAEVADLTRRLFGIASEPRFSQVAGRAWDVDDWYADATLTQEAVGWRSCIPLEEGLIATRDWWRGYLAQADFARLTKRTEPRQDRRSVSAIVACYRDEPAIPIMHERLVATFRRIGVDYEILFVDDGSPDNSVGAIRAITARDPHTIGISHSRNFGSQAAFRSGMEMASKEACVLLDGDLQDPPELIEDFVREWWAGADVVYGRRVRREMPRYLELFYRAFYRLLAAVSELPIPKDAGDFSLIDRAAVHWILQCRERDAFLRGLRAYVGFKQVGVDYVRPERAFGVSTNSWIKNIGWAKKAIFSFSRVPLHLLTALGGLATVATVALALLALSIRLLAPESVPKGITFLSLLVMFFGSCSILGTGLLGEYIGKILEETKARPPFIRRNLIVGGEDRPPPHRAST